MRTFVRQVMGSVAQLEASMVRKRLQRGRRLKHARGGYVGGAIGYGQRVAGAGKGAQREGVPADLDVIERMRARRAEGVSYANIAAELNASGVPSAQGKRWHANAVRRILNREAFVSSVVSDVESTLDEREGKSSA